MADIKQTARERYQQLSSLREPFIHRAKECSKYTIPTIFPENIDERNTGTEKLDTPYQSAGSSGVNCLSSKLLLSLFPAETSFLRLEPSAKVQAILNDMDEKEAQTYKNGLEQGLAKIEEMILKDINNGADRTVLKEFLTHVITTGNGLIFESDTGLRFYPLNQYVVTRDASGKILEIILREFIAPSLLKPEIRQMAIEQPSANDDDSPIEIYTSVTRRMKNWEIHQEIADKTIPDSTGTYPLDACPWIAPRIIRVAGSAYGRSYVEEYLGDLKSLESLSESLILGASVSSKVLFLVNPAGTTDETDLQDAASGDFVTGNAEDVTVLQVDKAQDFQTVLSATQTLRDSLSHAFLQNSAIQRNGERVTAEEIRYVAQELEDVLGGVYALLSQELQLPYVKAKLIKLMKSGAVAQVSPDLIDPKIITGLDALGKRHDAGRITEFLTTVAQNLGPQAIAEYCNVTQIITKLGLSMGVATEGIIKTEEQLQQERQQAQQQQMQQTMLDKGTGPAINQIGNYMTAQGGSMPNGNQQAAE
jgi:hypothetical protein